jgi:membrane protease YdiL (CAAX protease family)
MAASSPERHKDFPDAWSAALILGLLVGIEILIAAGLWDAGARFGRGDPKYMGVITVFGCGIVFSLLLSYKNLTYSQLFHPSSRPVHETVRPLVMPLLLMTAGSVILATEVNNLLVYLFPMSQSELEMFIEMVSGGVVSVITLCIIAPFVEEMLFRGLFLRSFLWNYSSAKAIALTSLLFGAAHLNVYQFVVASILGLISGWLYLATRSLWPCIFEHAIYNSGVMLYYFQSGQEPRTTAASIPVHNPFVLLLAVASFAFGLYWIYLVLERRHSDVSSQP